MIATSLLDLANPVAVSACAVVCIPTIPRENASTHTIGCTVARQLCQPGFKLYLAILANATFMLY